MLANTLSEAGYSGSYAYMHLGQQWQGPINGNGPQQQYLYCDSSHPHQLKGLYPIGTTCATSGTATANYSASYDSWGNMTSRTYAGTSATLSYDVLDHLVQWSGTNTITHLSSGQQWSVYDASGQRVLQRSTIQYDTPLTVYAFGSDEHDYSATGQGGNSLYYYSLGGRLTGVLYGTETDALVIDAQGSVLSRMTTTAGIANSIASVVNSVKAFAQFAFGLADFVSTSIKFGLTQILKLAGTIGRSGLSAIGSGANVRSDSFQEQLAGVDDESPQAAKADCQAYHVLAQC